MPITTKKRRKVQVLKAIPFQAEAAKSIADRYAFFCGHPDRPRKGAKPRPFFQALSALTGAGKTPVLAQAVSFVRASCSGEPIVFWISKAKSVVAQTLANFSPGGKYSELTDGFKVISVAQLAPELISDSSTALLVLATTGLFNNKDQSEGALNIYKRDADLFGENSPWERLIERADNGKRRPLLIVYDEGHNLSEQQTAILGELEPDGYLLASATLKLPDSFNKSVIQHVRLWVEDLDPEELKPFGALDEEGRPDAQKFITTAISSERVVDAELVKKAIQFDGTTAAMEKSLDELTYRLNILQREIDDRGLGFKPKAIYVCRTNIADDGEKDDHSKPFAHRKAPPIRIWRYLVNQKGVDPKSIAIYADLTFDDGAKPPEVNLFSKGDSDFDDFRAGDYQHIIFNLSLQEGWDDPGCYLAYIDKSMGSSIQVEQVIGRVLRQYGATHYDNPLLNSAHFFLRVDSQNVFADAISGVKTKLQNEGAPIEIIDNFGGGGGTPVDIGPKEDVKVTLCQVHVDAEVACEHIAELVSQFPTFAEGASDSIGKAHTISQVLELKNLNKEAAATDWAAGGQTNPVRLRWLANAALRSRSNRALAVTDFKDAKFDVRVQMQSNAHKAADKLTREIVEMYYEHAELVYECVRPFQFGTIRVSKKATSFANGLYERYSGFNKLELAFAQALDKVAKVWHRNPSSGGFHIPLLSEGTTSSFYPDFIVWSGKLVYCLDTKGGHLLSDAVARKLFDIQDGGKTRLLTRFITEGRQTELRGKVVKGGYTVWKAKMGKSVAVHAETLEKAAKECLK